VLDAKLVNEFQSLQDRVDGDARIAEASKRWSLCVAAGGFPADSPDGLTGAVAARVDLWKNGTQRSIDLLAIQKDEIEAAKLAYRCELSEIRPAHDLVEKEVYADFRAKYGL
jgi:hypothetical protein